MKIVDLAKSISPDCTFKITGIRPGEKLHESLISFDEARSTKIVDGIFVIVPQFEVSDKTNNKYGSTSLFRKALSTGAILMKSGLAQKSSRK